MIFRVTLLLILLAASAVGQPSRYFPFLADSSSPVVAPYINFLTNLSTTTDTAYGQTEEFTPTANNVLLIANIMADTLASTITVTNTGTTNLTWWPVTGQFISSVLNHKVYVTQLPEGTSPFAMRVTVNTPNNPTGKEIHVWEVHGANSTELWGTNAIVQQTSTAAIATSPYQFVFTSPATAGSSLFLSVAHNTGTDSAHETGFTLGKHTGHTSPTHELDSIYRTNSVGGVAHMWSTNSGTRYFAVIEIRP